MTEEQKPTESRDPVVSQESPVMAQKDAAGTPKKKKASWLRTILWMIGMMLIVNVIMGIIAYFMFRK